MYYERLIEKEIERKLKSSGAVLVALITTVGGLIVAMILQVFYNYILAQIEKRTIEMEDASISLVDILVKYQNK